MTFTIETKKRKQVAKLKCLKCNDQ